MQWPSLTFRSETAVFSVTVARLRRREGGDAVPYGVVAGWENSHRRMGVRQFGTSAQLDGVPLGREWQRSAAWISAVGRPLAAPWSLAQSAANQRKRRWSAMRENRRRQLTPRAGVERRVENRRRDSRSWERGGANVPPSGATGRPANWSAASAPGTAPSARPLGAPAVGATGGKASPAQRAAPTPRPPL